MIEKTPSNGLNVRWSATSCQCRASKYKVGYFTRDYCGVETDNTMAWQTSTDATLPIQGAYSYLEVSVTPWKVIGRVTGRPLSASLDGITSGNR